MQELTHSSVDLLQAANWPYSAFQWWLAGKNISCLLTENSELFSKPIHISLLLKWGFQKQNGYVSPAHDKEREYLWTARRETEVRRKERTCKGKRFVALKLLLMETFIISVTTPSFINKFSLFSIVYSLGLMHCNIHFSSLINWGTVYTRCKYRIIPLTSGGSWVDASVNESRMLFNTSLSGSALALYKEN